MHLQLILEVVEQGILQATSPRQMLTGRPILRVQLLQAAVEAIEEAEDTARNGTVTRLHQYTPDDCHKYPAIMPQKSFYARPRLGEVFVLAY